MPAERLRCSLIEDFLAALQKCLEEAPSAVLESAMFDTFKYTTTGSCFCHPRTLGFLAKAAWSLPTTAAVEIDVHLNSGDGIRFNPDVVLRDGDGVALLAIDFESPNSGDPRVIEKDVGAYLRWIDTQVAPVPYLIITSLPSKQRSRSEWTVRYYRNADHSKSEVRENPLKYWCSYWRDHLDPRWKDHPVEFANFDGTRLHASTELLMK